MPDALGWCAAALPNKMALRSPLNSDAAITFASFETVVVATGADLFSSVAMADAISANIVGHALYVSNMAVVCVFIA